MTSYKAGSNWAMVATCSILRGYVRLFFCVFILFVWRGLCTSRISSVARGTLNDFPDGVLSTAPGYGGASVRGVLHGKHSRAAPDGPNANVHHPASNKRGHSDRNTHSLRDNSSNRSKALPWTRRPHGRNRETTLRIPQAGSRSKTVAAILSVLFHCPLFFFVFSYCFF